MKNFVSIDVETANADMASICQIGIACYSDGALIKEWSSLIDPEDFFDDMNVSIHGINEKDIEGHPTFSEIYPEIEKMLSHTICVSHTHFDRVSLGKVINKYQLPPIETTWLDSAKVARRAWEECAWKGYGLANVCKLIGYEFKHHDALEDAKACGAIIHAAMDKAAIDLSGWLTRVGHPIGSDSGGKISRDGNPEGDFYGSSLVFTGSLAIPRAKAADMASTIGFSVANSVTKKTNYLVVGDQDIQRLAGKEKSNKHQKAEQLIAQGQDIRILMESDFRKLVECLALQTA